MIGWRVARNNLVTFEEYWNGWELAAVKQDVPCTRDGPCRWEYDCDPYLVSYSCNCDKDGNCDTCYRTEYHDCPYVKTESHYIAQTTLGDFSIAEHRFPENPQANRWRNSERIPEGVINRAGVGAPSFWLGVKERTEAKDPGPVCVRKEYENYILASDQTILKRHSSDVAAYRTAGLLPAIQSDVHNFYLSDKAYFVGYKPQSAAEAERWQSSLRRINGALGTELQGDLHLVVVKHRQISQNADAYALALQAHWQDKQAFGRKTLSKNGIVVIVGTEDGETVAWSKAFTGMPMGNEPMLVSLRNLHGTPLMPGALIGDTHGEFYQKGDEKTGTWKLKVRGRRSGGALERILWGDENAATRFARVSMSGKDADDNGSGFLYLRGEIQPTRSQQVWITICTFLACSLVWVVTVFTGRQEVQRRYYR